MRRSSRTISNRKRRQRQLNRISLIAAPMLAIPGAVLSFAPVSQSAPLDPCQPDEVVAHQITCVFTQDTEFHMPPSAGAVTISARGTNGESSEGGSGGRGVTAWAVFPPFYDGVVLNLDVAGTGEDEGAGGEGGGGSASVVSLQDFYLGVPLLAGGGGGGAGTGVPNGDAAVAADAGGGDAGTELAAGQFYAPGDPSPGGADGGSPASPTPTEPSAQGADGEAGGGGGGGGIAPNFLYAYPGGGGAGGTTSLMGGGGGASWTLFPGSTTFTLNGDPPAPPSGLVSEQAIMAPAPTYPGQIVITYIECVGAQGVSIADAEVVETDSGPNNATLNFTVSLTDPSHVGGGTDACSDTVVTVETNSTMTSPANTPDDYEDLPSTYTVTIPLGQTSAQGSVRITGDLIDEPDETFELHIVSADSPGATSPTDDPSITTSTATATIIDDDEPGEEEPNPVSPPIPGGGQCGGQAVSHAGSSGDDVIDGTPGDDVIRGGSGNDVINGHGGHDVICGNGGNDVINGGGGTGFIFGNAGNDEVNADGGSYSVDLGSGEGAP